MITRTLWRGLTILLLTLGGAPARAAEGGDLGPLKANLLPGKGASAADLTRAFVGQVLPLEEFSSLYCRHDWPNRLSCELGDGVCKGTWKLKGNVLSGNAKCKGAAPIVYDLTIENYSEEAIVGVLRRACPECDNPFTEALLVLSRGATAQTRKDYQLTSVPPVQVIPASDDRALFDRVVAHLRADRDVAVFVGEPAKNQRDSSEVWYLDDFGSLAFARLWGGRTSFEGHAWRLAHHLDPLVGPTLPKKWEWGGAYGLVVVVGKELVKRPIVKSLVYVPPGAPQSGLVTKMRAAGVGPAVGSGKPDAKGELHCRPAICDQAEAFRARWLEGLVPRESIKPFPPTTWWPRLVKTAENDWLRTKESYDAIVFLPGAPTDAGPGGP